MLNPCPVQLCVLPHVQLLALHQHSLPYSSASSARYWCRIIGKQSVARAERQTAANSHVACGSDVYLKPLYYVLPNQQRALPARCCCGSRLFLSCVCVCVMVVSVTGNGCDDQRVLRRVDDNRIGFVVVLSGDCVLCKAVALCRVVRPACCWSPASTPRLGAQPAVGCAQ